MTSLGDILVVGLGSSGYASALYASRLVTAGEAATVTVVDAAESALLDERAAYLRANGVNVALGVDGVAGRFDLAVVSPGVPPHAAVFRAAEAASARLVSEIEFAFSQSSNTWVAVTGTNGKTTTTSLIAHLLQTASISARAVGNIGAVAIEAVESEYPAEVLVAEVSSFQLAYIETFRPHVAVLLNLTPDHVNWHGTLEKYASAKARVFENLLEDDLAIIDVDDPGSAPYAEDVSARGIDVLRVSTLARHAPGATVIDGVLCIETRGGLVRLIAADELQIRGAHNVSNALAAAAAAHALGASASDLQRGLRTFKPIEHRLEPVAEIAGVGWFNDSKATNPDAVLKALTAFGNRPLIVMLGGRNKGNDMRPLAEAVSARARGAIVFGEAGPEIVAAFAGLDMRVDCAGSLAEAVRAAASRARAGDAVVLSPACASFDEFTSYEHRGEIFKKLVSQLKDEVSP